MLFMNRTQRIIVIVYCLLLAYCCLWVPWHLVQGPDHIRAGYGWLWIGPSNPPYYAFLTTPDLPIIALRFLATTVICGAAFLIPGMFRSSEKVN